MGLFSKLKRLFARQQLVGDADWNEAFAATELLARLTESDRSRLRALAQRFMNTKSIEAAAGIRLDAVQRARIALLICLPILNLGLEWYEGWYSVIVYPDEFVSEYEEIDESGVVHRIREPRSGESWQHGPMIVSWDPIDNPLAYPDHNLVIHECAHKLDGLNGALNGFPPLHAGMDHRRWTEVFEKAYADFEARVDSGQYTRIDPYALEAPAEFFAVMSEVFFASPTLLAADYPDVYDQLRLFYRQDPTAATGG